MSPFTPKSLNIHIKSLHYHIGANTMPPSHSASVAILELARSSFVFFTAEEIAGIMHGVFLAHIELIFNRKDEALRALSSIRERIIHPKLVKSMLISNRLMKADRDIGTLSILPDIALYKIKQHLK
jgi:hypothetical protein